MAIFDFLNSQQTGTLNTTTSIDPQIKQAYLSNLNFADTVASRPYQQYSGPRIAGFTPNQEQAFGQVQGMQGQFNPALSQAQQMTQGVGSMQPGQITPQSFLSGNIQAYQNPYTDQVVNQTMRDIERQRTMADQGVRANAIGSGAFGGTREAISRAENNRNFLDTSARTLAQLRNQGFDTAANLMQGDIGRDFQAQQANQQNQLAFGNQRLGAAGQLGGLANLQQQLGLNATNALSQVGQQQQGQTQRNFDLANQDFQNQFNYPLQQLAIRQGALGANIPNTGGTQSQPLFENQLGNLIGLGKGINSLFGQNDNGQSSFLGGIGQGIVNKLPGLLDFNKDGGLGFDDISSGFNKGLDFLFG